MIIKVMCSECFKFTGAVYRGNEYLPPMYCKPCGAEKEDNERLLRMGV